jgi:hypothetical protein
VLDEYASTSVTLTPSSRTSVIPALDVR